MANYFLKFKEWYSNLGGKSIKINFQERFVLILSEDGHVISIAHFANSIPSFFTLDDLLETQEKKENDSVFFVVLDGIGGKNWIYTRKIVGILTID